MRKYDHPPKLGPGCHKMDAAACRRVCLEGFSGTALTKRQHLFGLLEGVVTQLTVAQIICRVFVDGSILTDKPEPSDIDVMVVVDLDVYRSLDVHQGQLLADIMEQPNPELDSFVSVLYPREHPEWKANYEVGNPGDLYGLEHSETWLKGYVQINVGENHVGNRISS